MGDDLQLPAGCPPEQAQPAAGKFFRLVSGSLSVGDEPGSEDWVIPAKKRKGECVGRFDCCECYSHSLFLDVNDLINACETTPWARKKAIAEVVLEPSYGVVVKTSSSVGDSHHDWWASPLDLVPSSRVMSAKP